MDIWLISTIIEKTPSPHGTESGDCCESGDCICVGLFDAVICAPHPQDRYSGEFMQKDWDIFTSMGWELGG